MLTLLSLTLLPLAMIALQLALDFEGHFGFLGYSFYKLFLLLPPLLYCRSHGIKPVRDVFKLQNWRRGLAVAFGLGVLAVAIFWGLYYRLGDILLDKAMITHKIGEQFSVTGKTVLLIAPVTIFLNSMLEEFFYRGFAFGQLVQGHRTVGYLLPAGAFTIQHLFFIYHWMSPLPFAMAVLGLFVFALALQRVYEKSESLVAPWLIHIMGDVAMMSIAVTLLR
jgi:membrane protease YdiL (CAAX protease family)